MTPGDMALFVLVQRNMIYPFCWICMKQMHGGSFYDDREWSSRF